MTYSLMKSVSNTLTMSDLKHVKMFYIWQADVFKIRSQLRLTNRHTIISLDLHQLGNELFILRADIASTSAGSHCQVI